MNKKKLGFYLILLIVFLLSVGGTYAFFSYTVLGDSELVNTSTGTLRLSYSDGPEIIVNEFYPGDTINKTIYVTNTGSMQTNYDLSWKELTNGIINDELLISYTCTSYVSYGRSGEALSGTCTNLENKPIPASPDVISTNNIIDPGITHVIDITIEFIETGSAQNYNQGKTFAGLLNVGGVNAENRDMQLLSMYVDNIEVNSLDSAKMYNLLSYTCDNGESIAYNKYSKSLLIEPFVNTTSCSLYFEEQKPAAILTKILSHNTAYPDNVSSEFVSGALGIDYANESSDTNGKGLYYTTDPTKTENGQRVYFFRGDVLNNNLIFAGYCWFIVRSVEDGSVRLLYHGVPTVTDGVSSCPPVGSDQYITSGKFNDNNNDNAYAGYMYGTVGASTYAEAHANEHDSTIKTIIDTWYSGGFTTTNICNDSICDFRYLDNKLIDYSSYIADTPYCNDRSVANEATMGYSTVNTNYEAYRRTNTPTYVCVNQNDQFTLRIDAGGYSNHGNNALTYPIGLLTYDEIATAGKSNTSSYYRSSWPFKLISPYFFVSSCIYSRTSGSSTVITSKDRIAPAISLKASTVIESGTGLASDPYIVDTD